MKKRSQPQQQPQHAQTKQQQHRSTDQKGERHETATEEVPPEPEEEEEEERLLTVGECAQLSNVDEVWRALESVARAEQATDLRLRRLLPTANRTPSSSSSATSTLEGGVARSRKGGITNLRDADTEDEDSSRQLLLRRLDTLEILPMKLQPLFEECRSLSNTIESTCSLAELVSAKIRQLDLVRGRVLETRARIGDVLDLRDCVSGVESSIAQGQYEVAAAHLQRYAHLDPTMLQPQALEQLHTARLSLLSLLRQHLATAVLNDNLDDVVRFSILFSPLDERQEGITQFVAYLRQQVARKAEADYRKILSREDVAYQISAIPKAVINLTNHILNVIRTQRTVLIEHFGNEGLLKAIQTLQVQSDASGTKLLDLFEKLEDLSSLTTALHKNKRTPGSAIRQHAKRLSDPVALAGTLEAIVLMSQRIHIFQRRIRALVERTQSEAEKPVNSRARVATLEHSQLWQRVQELLIQYMTLEEYFMVASVRKAVNNDEEVDGSLTSSMVDHVFYILRECTRRAVASADINNLCGVVTLVSNCLRIDFKADLHRMLTERALRASTTATSAASSSASSALSASSSSTSSSSSSSASSSSAARQNSSYMVILNNLEVSSEYIMKLKLELEGECAKVFGQQESSEKITYCLNDLLETSKSFQQVLLENLSQMARTIQPSLRPILELFQTVRYDVSEAQFLDADQSNEFMNHFFASLMAVLDPFAHSLTPTNFDHLLHIIIRQVATRLEKLLLQKTFTQLGGLKCDKDLRAMVAFFSQKTQRTVRGEFARLIQMASLLSLERVAEVLDYWGGEQSAHITWRLTPSEVRLVLSRRIDFAPNDIAQLAL